MAISNKDAAIAWRNLKEFVTLPNHVGGHVQDLDEYFKGVLSKPLPLPPQQAATKRCNCREQLWGTDQYRCIICGLTWDRDEKRPACPLSRVDNTAED